jgi:PKD domain
VLCAAAALFAVPGDAHAERFCVNKVLSCLLTGTSKATIQEALDAAELNNEEDTVLVGAHGGVPYSETLTYSDSETVHIVGDGVGQTIVSGPISFSNAVTLLNPNSTIEDLTIRAPDVSNGAALRWNGTAAGIEAVHLGSTATETLGMIAEGNAVLEDSVVGVNGFGLFKLSNAIGVEIRDSTLKGDGGGIDVGGGDLTLKRSTVTAQRSALSAGFGSEVEVDAAVLRMLGTSSTDAAVAILSGGEAVIRHATIVGAGSGYGVAVDAFSTAATVTVFSSIVDNFDAALRCFGEGGSIAHLGISYSNWTDPTELTDPECTKTIGAGNDTVTDPVYVATQFIPNFRLRAPSPLIDAGDPTDTPGEDLARALRPVDGDGVGGARSDIGAYEYQRQAPKASIKAPATAAIGEAAAFSASGSSDPDPGDVLSYSWDFGDGGSGTGSAPTHAFSAGGDYAVTLTATDPTGLKATATAQVQVPAAPEGGAPGGDAPAGDGSGAAVASLSRVRAVPKLIKRGKGKPRLLKGAKRGIRFALSAAAKLTLSLQRCRGKHGCAKKSAVPGSASFAAPAGIGTISFKGRLRRKALPPGRYRATLSVEGGGAKSTPLILP